MLSVWLPLNGDLRNQGLSNITATNNGATVDNNGKIGKCYSFDGNDDFINLGNIGSHFNGSAFSICFWIFSLENKTRAAVFSGYGLSSTSNFFGLELNSSNNNYCNNNLRFDWLGSDTYSPDDFVTYNAWTHICVTYDGVNQIKMYKNGELIQTSTRVLNAIPVGNTYYLGRDSRTGSTAFSGKLNDFRIYDHCLSPRECKQVSTALVVHYPLSGIGNPNLCVPQFDDAKWSAWGSSPTREKIVDSDGKTWIHVIHSSTEGYGGFACTSGSNGNGIVIDPNKKYTISVLAKTNEATTQKMVLWCHWRVAGGGGSNLAQTMTTVDVTSIPKRVYATWTPTAGSSGSVVGSINLMLGVYKNISNIYFTDIKFEEGEVATPWLPNPTDPEYTALGLNDGIEYDVSGYGNNGIKYGSLTYSSDTPRYNTSAVFNGTDNCIQFPFNNFCTNGDIFTMNIWWKKTALGSKSYETLVGGPSGFEMDTRSGAAQALSLYMATTRGGNLYSPFNMNEWYMVTLVNDGTNELYYVNGVLVNTIAKKNMPSGNYYIGAWQIESKQNFCGNMSDFRFYKTALSAEDIQELYHTPETLAINGTLLTQGEYVES